jgi:hypothetical protein
MANLIMVAGVHKTGRLSGYFCMNLPGTLFAGARSGSVDVGGVPAPWDLRRDVLQVEGQVWRAGGVGGAPAEVTRR